MKRRELDIVTTRPRHSGIFSRRAAAADTPVELSALYNSFFTCGGNYMAQVNMIFESFNLHDELFAKHQLKYLGDLVRVLFYTGARYNFYDVIVMLLDRDVLKEQIEKAVHRLDRDHRVTVQQRLNSEMSVKNLMQSLEDRERVPKIQGLINACMTFLDDELSAITGQYDDLQSIEDVIDQELILFVSLNANKNIEPVRSLGKMLLQNIQLSGGKRYEDPADRRRQNRLLFSVVLDEFAPFGYRNFAQILQTARGGLGTFYVEPSSKQLWSAELRLERAGLPA